MKPISMLFLFILLLAGSFPTLAQYDGGYTCWQCPVCGSVFQLTAYEAASTSAYALCPACGSAYAGYFIQVPCQGGTSYSQSYGPNSYNTPSGSDQGTDLAGNSIGKSSTNNQANSQTDGQTNIQANSEATKGKILMVVAPKDYQEMELNIPRDYFRSKGYSVIVASKGVKTAKSMGGETTPVDIDIKNVKVSDYRAIVFVGGEGIYDQKLNEDTDYQQLAKSAGAKEKLIGAICLGPWILADAGLLQGKKSTAAETDHLKEKGAIVSDESVVQDGNIITGNGPDASLDFAEKIIEAIEGESGPGASSEEGENALRVPSNSPSSDTSSEVQPAQYECTVCHYVYDPAVGDPSRGIPAGTPFEKLPASWKCPCGASKDKFVKI